MKLRHAVVAFLLTALATPAAAQLPPNQPYATFTSRHFRITYDPTLEAVARHAAASAERAREALLVLVADEPPGTIDILITDNVDFTNGYARILKNRITIYARPPNDLLELQYMRDWIELVVTHELAHIYHLDVSGGLGSRVRSIFGRLPAPWPVYAALATPGWSSEGLATVIESTVTGFGRTHGSYHEMIVRTAVLEGGFNDIDLLFSSSPAWPGGGRVYTYGALFLDYLERRFGADAIVQIVQSLKDAWYPPFLWFDRIGKDALGVSFREAYRDWQTELKGRYALLDAELRAAGLTVSEPLTSHRAHAYNPRFSPDGRRIAYTAADGRVPARLRVIDVRSGDEIWSDRQNNIHSQAAWIDDARLIAGDYNFTDPFHVKNDLHVVTPAGDARITTGKRYEQPDARNGSLVAIENGPGSNRIVLLDDAGRMTRELTQFDTSVLWSFPRFSPRGDRIAVTRWRMGGRMDIVVMNLDGTIIRELAGGDGLNSAPAWTPDERWLLFQSDRTGIPNLFATDLAASQPRVLQVTNVLTGAFMPDVSPDGKAIVFAAAHRDGFVIERIAFDTTQWRTPLAEPAVNSARAPYENTTATRTLADAVNAAVSAADTATGVAAPYRALAHMRPYYWTPVIETQGTEGLFIGAGTSADDLVGRHYAAISAAFDPSSGRTAGNAGYTYRGLPSVGRAHPAISIAAVRFWDTIQPRDSAGGLYIDEREDVAFFGLGFSRPAYRSTTGFNLSTELLRRSRQLGDAPENARLRDPVDDLYGVRATTFFANYSQPSFAISRQDGVLMQLSALQRWERDPLTFMIDDRSFLLDGSYSEVFATTSAYRSLPTRGFARHVIALRAAGIRRSGPGAGLVRTGGTAASGFDVPGLSLNVGNVSQLLAVRGFDDGQRRGNLGWAASAEYRVPIALITRALRPLPLYFDRIAASAFADAGHAWCDDPTAARFAASSCQSTTASATPLLSAGLELTAFLSTFGASLPVRGGVAVPIAGDDRRSPRFHIVFGTSF